MNIIKNNFLFFGLSIIVGAILYWPSFNGTPIWDDFIYLFSHPIRNDVSYLNILLQYAWPVSVMLQKLQLQLFGDHYLSYHILNFLLHTTNSYLLYRLLKRFNIPYAKGIYLLFFFHPSNVIAVAWIIQLKTLLSFFFGILSFDFFMKSIDQETKRKRYLFLSTIFFGLSFFAKPITLFLPVVFFCILWQKKLIRSYLIPICIVALITTAGAFRTLIRGQLIINETQENVVGPKDLPQKLSFALKASKHYIWQSFIPSDLAPVKGQVTDEIDFTHITHIIFLLCLISLIIYFKTGWTFILGHLMLFPFLGLLEAPYMYMSWVSDQHLYVALPFFLVFLVQVLNKLSQKWVIVSLFILLGLFSFKTFETNKIYQNEISFYKAGLEHNPYNLGITYNLIYAYLKNQQLKEAQELSQHIIDLASYDPKLKKDSAYIHILLLHLEMQNHSVK